jgi:hypothetical protein
MRFPTFIPDSLSYDSNLYLYYLFEVEGKAMMVYWLCRKLDCLSRLIRCSHCYCGAPSATLSSRRDYINQSVLRQ